MVKNVANNNKIRTNPLLNQAVREVIRQQGGISSGGTVVGDEADFVVPGSEDGEQQTDYNTIQNQLLKEALASLEKVKNNSIEERSALDADLSQKAAKTLLDQKAKAGAAGLSLSGAGLSLEAGTKGKLDRDKALAMGDFDRGTREEVLAAIGNVADISQGFRSGDIAADKAEHDRQMSLLAIKKLEAELGIDLDGDGIISTGQQPGATDEDPQQTEDPAIPAIDKDGDHRTEEDDDHRSVEISDVDLDYARRHAEVPGSFIDTMFLKGFIGEDEDYDYYEGIDGKIWKIKK